MAWEWVAPAITGTIGTITISTTVWLAHKQFHFQETRAIKSERRTVYGQFLKYVNQMEDCGMRLVVNVEGSVVEKEDADAYKEARSLAAASLAEISILGPDEVWRLAESYFASLLKVSLEEDRHELIPAKNSMIDAMRKELLNT